MKPNQIIVCLLLFSLIATPVARAQPDSLVSSGNAAYTEARYQQAVDDYLSVIDQGFTSPELYYNLGNAYFKLNNIPSAILYYEKALKLNPKDEDIRFNLELANSRIIDKIEPVPEFFLKKWWGLLVNLMNPDQWARTGIMFFLLLLVSAGVFMVANPVALRKIAFWSAIVLLLVCLTSFYMAIKGHHSLQNNTVGIVFTPTVTVKSSPSDNSVDLFVIHEGTKVHILDTLDGWTEVRIANGSKGWVKASDYRAV